MDHREAMKIVEQPAPGSRQVQGWLIQHLNEDDELVSVYESWNESGVTYEVDGEQIAEFIAPNDRTSDS